VLRFVVFKKIVALDVSFTMSLESLKRNVGTLVMNILMSKSPTINFSWSWRNF